MKNIQYIITAMILLVFITSCRKDSDVTVWDQEGIETSINGFVYSETNDLVAGASVTVGNQSTMTDQFGYFSFEAIKYTNEVYVKINKAGYFLGSRTLYPVYGKKNHARVKLIPLNFDYQFDASSGSTVAIGDEVTLTFPKDAIADKSGNLYTGNVKMAIHYIDPTTNDGQREMPGTLVGLDSQSEAQYLHSYGMVAVEMRNDNAEELNIMEGKEVIMEIEIPSELRSQAPNTIPLWHFNEDQGIWVEEGSAINDGATYVGKVKHFSFWNCDYPASLIHLKGKITNGREAINGYIKLTALSNNSVKTTIVGEDGIFEGKVPKDEKLLLEFTDACNNTLLSKEIGPYSSDVILDETPILLLGSIITTNISGKILDCNNAERSSNHYIQIKRSEEIETIPAGSTYDYKSESCVALQQRLKALDFDNFLESEEVVIPYGGNFEVDFKICDTPLDLPNFFILKSSDSYRFTLEQFEISESENSIWVNGFEGETPTAFVQMLHDPINISQNLGVKIPLSKTTFQEYSGEKIRVVNPTLNQDDYIIYTSFPTKEGEFLEGTGKLSGFDIILNNAPLPGFTNIDSEFIFRVRKND